MKNIQKSLLGRVETLDSGGTGAVGKRQQTAAVERRWKRETSLPQPACPEQDWRILRLSFSKLDFLPPALFYDVWTYVYVRVFLRLICFTKMCQSTFSLQWTYCGDCWRASAVFLDHCIHKLCIKNTVNKV